MLLENQLTPQLQHTGRCDYLMPHQIDFLLDNSLHQSPLQAK